MVPYGEKLGYIVIPLPPWLRPFSHLFKQSQPESPKDSDSNKLHAPEPLIALDQLRVISWVTVFRRNGSLLDMTSQTDFIALTLCKHACKVAPSESVVNKSFEAYKIVGFVRIRLKWPRCVSTRCKDSF